MTRDNTNLAAALGAGGTCLSPATPHHQQHHKLPAIFKMTSIGDPKIADGVWKAVFS